MIILVLNPSSFRHGYDVQSRVCCASATGPVKFSRTENQMVNAIRPEIYRVSALLNLDKWTIVALCGDAGCCSQFHFGGG